MLIGSLGVGLACAGCGSGGGTTSPKAGSPQAVATAAAKALAAGDYGTLCHYLPPAAQPQCKTGAPHTFTVGGFKLGNSDVQGDRALVVIEADRVCVAQQSCASNHDPNLGLPNGSVTFADAFRNSLTGKAFFTTSLTNINGKWYIEELLYRA